MQRPNKVGFHTKLTPQVHNIIIDAVPKVLVKSQIAALAGILPDTLSDWLDRGKKEAAEGLETPFTHLSREYAQKRAEFVRLMIEKLLGQDSYQSVSWLMEHCMPEEFSNQSDMIKELTKNVEILIGEKGLRLHGNEK